ncbi:MAG: mannose-6-phosphate isomerase, partial [Treponema sp.]|nr:mannose-6-phosphate isomerase [Treponema sp.]
RFECKYFSLEEINVAGEARLVNGAQNAQLVYILEGSGSVGAQDFAAEDIFALAPGEEAAFKSQNARVLKICAK